MAEKVIYFEKFCKNCGCNKTFKRFIYPNGKSIQRCIDCAKKTRAKIALKPEFKEKRKEYQRKRLQKLHEAGIVKPRQTPVMQAVYNESGLKRCNKCFEFKEEDLFAKANRKRGTVCKVCRNKQQLQALKANNDAKARKLIYDRERARQRDPEKNKEICKRYQEKIRPIRKKESFEKQISKGLSCKMHWYKCKRCNSLKYVKRRYNINEICKSCINIGSTRIIELRPSICPICNKEHMAKQKNVMCIACEKHKNKVYRRIVKSKRRAMIKKAKVAQSVDPLCVFKRDGYKCKFCGIKVQKKDVYADNAAELDHIIPLSKGGAHAYYNCQTLCRRCNRAKSNKLLGQLMMDI